MFFVVDLWRNVSLTAAQLGRNYEECVDETLRSEVEGQCNETFGFTVCVVRTLVRELGRVQDGTGGTVVVPVKYQAIVCKPFRDEVIDGKVTAVNHLGFFAQSGPIKAFVSRNAMPEYFEFTDGAYSDGESFIRPDSEVRIKLRGIKFEQTGIIAVASINEDYLGLLSTQAF